MSLLEQETPMKSTATLGEGQQKANNRMQKYLLSPKKQRLWQEGDSVVRSSTAYGACGFSIEQVMTISISESTLNPKFWKGLFFPLTQDLLLNC